MPPCPDDTDSFFRRYTQVGFNRKFLSDDPRTNPHLKTRVQQPDVCEVVLLWAVEGLKRLLKNKKFTFTKSIEETREQYIRSTNPTATFAMDNLEGNVEGSIKKESLYKNVMDYCEKFKLPTPSHRTFIEKLKENRDFDAASQVVCENNMKITFWRGISYTSNSPYNEDSPPCNKSFLNLSKKPIEDKEIKEAPVIDKEKSVYLAFVGCKLEFWLQMLK